MRTLALLTLLTLLGAAAADEKKPADKPKLSDEEKAVVEATNAERKKAGLEPLTPNAKLLEAARSHAENMARQDKLEHELDGKTPAGRVTEAGYTYARTGENIGYRYPTGPAAVTGWMDSPPHKENILNKEYTEIGVAVRKNAKGERYWVQVFGRPRP